MQKQPTLKQFIDSIDTLLDVTEQAGAYDSVLLRDYDEWFGASVGRRTKHIDIGKRIVGCVAIFAVVFLVSDTLFAQPDYTSHYSSQPCDVNISVQNLHNILNL